MGKDFSGPRINPRQQHSTICSWIIDITVLVQATWYRAQYRQHGCTETQSVPPISSPQTSATPLSLNSHLSLNSLSSSTKPCCSPFPRQRRCALLHPDPAVLNLYCCIHMQKHMLTTTPLEMAAGPFLTRIPASLVSAVASDRSGIWYIHSFVVTISAISVQIEFPHAGICISLQTHLASTV